MREMITKDKGIRFFLEEIRWTDVWLCLFAFIFARISIAEEFFVLGIAYLGSLFMSKELRRWATIFTILGLVSIQPLTIITMKYVFISGLIFVIREYMRMTKKTLDTKNQSIMIASSIWVISVLMMFIKGFDLLSFSSYLLEGAIGAAGVWMMHYGVNVIRDRRRTPLTTREAISMVIIFACILGGMVDFYIQMPFLKEIYLRDILTFIILIGVTYLGGITVGVTISMVISALLVMIGYMPVHFAPIYGIATLIGGLFLPLGRVWIIVAMGFGEMLGFAIFNSRVVDVQILGAYFFAAIISLILPKHYFGMNNWFGYKEEENEQVHLARVQSIITERLNHFSKAFEHLSNSFNEIMPKKTQLTRNDMKNIIEDTGEKLCANCSMNQFCWEQDVVNTYEHAYSMLRIAETKGYLTVGDIPEIFKAHCCNSEQFAYLLNFKIDLHKQNLMWQNRMAESRELVGDQLRAIATTIQELSTQVQEELYFNKDDEKKLAEALKAIGIKVKDVMIIENSGKKQEMIIYTAYCKKTTNYSDHMIQQAQAILGIKIELDKHECAQEGCKFKFLISKTYKVAAGAAFCAKNKISGDVYSFMELEDGQYLLALADGMGSGFLAQEESTATIELLEDFMEAGFKNDLAVKLINSVLVLKATEENFSTIDITLIDCYSGIAEFLKAGAATTFILRNGEVSTVRSRSFPVGLLKEVDLEIYKKQLQDGDMIIMVTDGMLANEEDVLGKEETFKHFIKEVDSNNPKYMAEYLMKKSCDLLGNGDRDDMTIVVAKIWEQY